MALTIHDTCLLVRHNVITHHATTSGSSWSYHLGFRFLAYLCIVNYTLQVYASYNYRQDLTKVVKVPGMLSRARSLSREEAETQEADVGKADVGVSLHPPTVRQAIAWELAMRNIRQSEVSDITPVITQHRQLSQGARPVCLRCQFVILHCVVLCCAVLR